MALSSATAPARTVSSTTITAPRPGQGHGVVDVLGAPLGVGVDEHQVERRAALPAQGGEAGQGGPDPDVDPVAEPGPVDVGLGDAGVAGLDLEGHQLAVGRQGPGQPDRAVAAEGAHLQDPAGAHGQAEELEQLPLVGRHLQGRQVGGVAGVEGGGERRVRGRQRGDEVGVDLGPPGEHGIGGRVGRGVEERGPVRGHRASLAVAPDGLRTLAFGWAGQRYRSKTTQTSSVVPMAPT